MVIPSGKLESANCSATPREADESTVINLTLDNHIVHGPTEVPMHPPPPMIHHEWYQIVQWDPQELFKRCCHFLNWFMHQWRSFY